MPTATCQKYTRIGINATSGRKSWASSFGPNSDPVDSQNSGYTKNHPSFPLAPEAAARKGWRLVNHGPCPCLLILANQVACADLIASQTFVWSRGRQGAASVGCRCLRRGLGHRAHGRLYPFEGWTEGLELLGD